MQSHRKRMIARRLPARQIIDATAVVIGMVMKVKVRHTAGLQSRFEIKQLFYRSKKNNNFTTNTGFMKKKFTQKHIHILEVAEQLIAKKGFEGTSVREISAKANINVAMINYYFGSKEKMMSSLYRYRVQRTRESFAEFAETIRQGKPEMQMKELIKYVVKQLFTYQYFHGFVTQELRHTEPLKDDLLEFYKTFTEKIGEVIRKGVEKGVFANTPKSEEILVLVVGAALFVIRNRNFFELYVPGAEEDYLREAQKKMEASLLVTVFSVLGYQPA